MSDNSGELDVEEFVVAAAGLPRLKAYFDRLAKMATDPAELAEQHEHKRQEGGAAIKIQVRHMQSTATHVQHCSIDSIARF